VLSPEANSNRNIPKMILTPDTSSAGIAETNFRLRFVYGSNHRDGKDQFIIVDIEAALTR
jgi:hypothetical protein